MEERSGLIGCLINGKVAGWDLLMKDEVQALLTDEEKVMAETSLRDRGPVMLGGGDRYTVTFSCQIVLGVQKYDERRGELNINVDKDGKSFHATMERFPSPLEEALKQMNQPKQASTTEPVRAVEPLTDKKRIVDL